MRYLTTIFTIMTAFFFLYRINFTEETSITSANLSPSPKCKQLTVLQCAVV